MATREYLDFEVEIGPGMGREYPVAVIRSPAGEARERFTFPFDELELENHLKDIQIALLRSGGSRRLALSPQEKKIREFGQELFNVLMTGQIRSRYEVSRRQAAEKRKGLRIKLRIQPPELLRLPWEFLYDPDVDYICLSTQTPLVRYIEVPQVIHPLTMALPLQILGVTSSPSGLEGLDVENEKLRVESALKPLIERNQVSITWQEHTTWRDLQRAMRQGPWHILHFIGHGSFDDDGDEGFIALENENGGLFRLPATQLARLLSNHTTLRLAILNSCESASGGRTDIFSSTASLLVRRGLPAVLAMQYEITDRAAIEFACGFYEALADGLPVDAATVEARISVSLGITNTIEWGTPVLFMRTADGVLFKPRRGGSKEPEGFGKSQNRLLEAAIEKEITVEKPTQLFVAIRRSGSKGIISAITSIDEEVQLDESNVKSKEIQVEFPMENGRIAPAKVTLRLTARDFDPPEQQKYVAIPPNADSQITTFMITPKMAGKLMLQLEVFKEGIPLASRTIRTTAINSDVTKNSMALFTIPVFVFVPNLSRQAEYIAWKQAEKERRELEKFEEAKRAEVARKEKEAAERLLAEQKEQERIAKEEAEHLAVLRAEEERLAREKTEAERLAKEKAERLFAEQKAKKERIAEEKRLAKAEAQRLARQQAKEFLLAWKSAVWKAGERVKHVLYRSPTTAILVAIVAFVALAVLAIWKTQIQNQAQASDRFLWISALEKNANYFTSDSLGKEEIYVLTTNAQPSQVTRTPEQTESWSPASDGHGNLYFTSNQQGDKAEIFVLTKDAQLRQVTHTPKQYASWSPAPDGQGNLYFTSNQKGGKAEIFVLAANSQLMQVTYTPKHYQSWSPAPDGQGNLYFTSNQSGKPEIYVLTADHQLMQVTYTPKHYQSWSPAPDGQGNLYFTSNQEGGKAEIFVLTVNSQLRQVTRIPNSYQSWSPVPDGHGNLYFTSDQSGNVEIFVLTAESETRPVDIKTSGGHWTGNINERSPGFQH